MCKEHLYKFVIDEHDPHHVHELTDKVIAACDDFFTFIATCDGTEYTDPDDVDGPVVHFESLWNHFDLWLSKVSEEYLPARDSMWLHPDGSAGGLWQQFLRVVPTIYVAVVDTYLHDPSKLDYVVRDPETGEEMRIPRRVTSILPEFAARHVWWDDVPREEVYRSLTPEEIRRGRIMDLVTGAAHSWPVPVYGVDVPDGKSKLL